MPREGRIICAIYVALISLARCTARARAIYGNLIICVSICQQFKGLVAVSHLFAGHVALLPLPSVIIIRKLHSRVAMGLHRKSGSFVVRGLQNEIKIGIIKTPSWLTCTCKQYAFLRFSAIMSIVMLEMYECLKKYDLHI